MLFVQQAAIKAAVELKGLTNWGMSFVSLPSLTINKSMAESMRESSSDYQAQSTQAADESSPDSPGSPVSAVMIYKLVVCKPLKCILRSHGEAERSSYSTSSDDTEELSRWDLSVEDDFAQLTITNLKLEYCNGNGEAVMDSVVLEDLRPASQRPMIPVPQNVDLLEEDTIRTMLVRLPIHVAHSLCLPGRIAGSSKVAHHDYKSCWKEVRSEG